jgi:hypothetical protein
LGSRLEEDSGKLAYCDVDGGLDAAFRSKFEDVASQAAVALGRPPNADPAKFWLSCLCLDLLQDSPEGARAELLRPVPGGGFIIDLLGSSAAYCSRLAAKAEACANEKLSRSPQSTFGSPPEVVTGSRGSEETAVKGKSNTPEKAARRRGFEADLKRHNSIADIAERHDPRWGHGSGHWRQDSILMAICTDFDGAEIDVPDSWRTAATPSLNGVKLKSRSDALELGYKKLVIDQIRHSLAIIRKKRSSTPSET